MRTYIHRNTVRQLPLSTHFQPYLCSYGAHSGCKFLSCPYRFLPRTRPVRCPAASRSACCHPDRYIPPPLWFSRYIHWHDRSRLLCRLQSIHLWYHLPMYFRHCNPQCASTTAHNPPPLHMLSSICLSHRYSMQRYGPDHTA